MPEGFTLELWTAEVPNARALARGERGTVFAGSFAAGKVYAIRGEASGRPRVWTIASGLNVPNGVAFRDGALYVAEVDRILRYDDIESRLESPPQPVTIATLPAERHHGARFIAFGPDGLLYVTVGAPCNVCDRDAAGFGTIRRMRADGSHTEIVAHGVRNSVGLAWQPRTNELWFTDNGRDLLGDDVPPCELNRLSRVGEHFGFPFCHGGDVVDPEFGAAGRCADATPPVQRLGAHVAPLGVAFTPDAGWPEGWRGGVVIAEHGSWNRSEKAGYRLSYVQLDGSRAAGYREFVGGWLDARGNVSGRPAGLLFIDARTLLVSDDRAGAIYRITPSEGG